MSISLQDPPDHVLPHAYDRSLTGYYVRLVLATLAAASPPTVILFMWWGEYKGFHTITVESVVQGLVFLWVGPAILFPTFMKLGDTFSSKPSLLPLDLLRLSRTPVGWALLREGAMLEDRRSGVKDLERSLPLFRSIAIGFNNAEQVLEHEANLLNAWNKLLAAETSLVDRQRRHLAGETVDEYDKSLASSP